MSRLSKPSRHPRFLIYGLLLTSVLLLSTPAVMADEVSSPTDSVGNLETKKYNFSFSMNIDGLFFGFYKNLTRQKGDPSGPLDLHAARGVNGEFGFGFRSFGLSYYLDALRSPIGTQLDDEGYSHGAGHFQHGIKASYQISFRTFHLIPEGGYVFLNEDAGIRDPEKKKPDKYYEKYKDEGSSYGLSARLKLIPVEGMDLWLYGRYVRDNMKIKTDNYWLQFHLGGMNLEPSESAKGTYVQSCYLILGVKWTKKTDGRSDCFLTLGMAVALGLL